MLTCEERAELSKVDINSDQWYVVRREQISQEIVGCSWDFLDWNDANGIKGKIDFEAYIDWLNAKEGRFEF